MLRNFFENGFLDQCTFRKKQDLLNKLKKALGISIQLEKEFGEVNLISFEGNVLNLKVENSKALSIGFLFGFLHQI